MIPALGAIGGALASNALNLVSSAVPTATDASLGENSSFAAMLQKLGAETVETIHQGESSAIGGIAGKLPLHQVVDELMSAERSLQTAIAVRDKTVQAYRDIINMAI